MRRLVWKEPGILDDGARGWLLRTARANHWRVAAWIDFDDLLQDGMVIFFKCKKKYLEDVPEGERRVHTQEHFFALVQRSFCNHITDLANEKTRSAEVPIAADASPDNLDDNDVLDRLVGGVPEESTLAVMLREAPAQVCAVLRLFTTEAGRARLRIIPREREDGTRETTNERLCYLIGLNPLDFDLVGAVRGYLTRD